MSSTAFTEEGGKKKQAIRQGGRNQYNRNMSNTPFPEKSSKEEQDINEGRDIFFNGDSIDRRKHERKDEHERKDTIKGEQTCSPRVAAPQSPRSPARKEG